jgi:hypothetical protein
MLERHINVSLFATLMLFSLIATACMPSVAKPVPRLFSPPPIQPQPVPAPPEIGSGPALQDSEAVPNPEEIVTLTMPRFPAPPKPPPARVAAPPKPAPPPTPAPPKITQLFSAEQLREYNKAYDDSQDRVRKALAILESKNLSQDQRNTMDRIKTFQMQAEQEHERDLVTAVNLARRADALSADLLRRFQ